MAQKFNPAHMARLDSPERKKILPANEILRAFGLSAGETMIDVGAGVGYFSIPASSIVGSSGKVIALDTSTEMIEEIQRRFLESGIENTEARISGEYEFGLESGIADFVLLSTVLHEVEAPDRMSTRSRGSETRRKAWPRRVAGSRYRAGSRVRRKGHHDEVIAAMPTRQACFRFTSDGSNRYKEVEQYGGDLLG
jgi:SAM-dependent methyltransferase